MRGRHGIVPRDRIARGRVGLAAASILAAIALVSQTGVTTNASWNDAEWVHAPAVSTLDCSAEEGMVTTRGEGKLLSGSLLGIDLDSLVQAAGTEVTNNGYRAKRGDGTVLAPGSIDYANPLDVTALSAITVNLGQELLQLPLDNSTGAINQYSKAANNGRAAGASGFVSDTGAISTRPENGYPELATLSLSRLLESINAPVANLLGDVTEISLSTGAVSGRSIVDSCDTLWHGTSPSDPISGVGNLQRDYLISDVRTNVTSNTVGALVTSVSNLIVNVGTAVSSVKASNNEVVNELLRLVNGLLNLPVANVEVEKLSATIDLDPVIILLEDTFSDDKGIVSISLRGAGNDGIISIDTAALFAEAYGATYGNGLNQLAPNTELLVNNDVIEALNAAVTGALENWLTDVETTLISQINNIQVELELKVTVLLIVSVTATINASLSALEANSPGLVQTKINLLGLDLGDLGTSIASLLTSNLGPLLAGVIRDLLPAVTGLVTSFAENITSVVNTIRNVYTQLYLNKIIELKVNVQNDQPGEPQDWEVTETSSIREGQFHVAALRIGILAALGNSSVHLYLARGSVGVTCTTAQAAQPRSPCANY